MNYKRLLGGASAALMIGIAIFILAPGACAQSKFKTLYKFRGHKDGGRPLANLVFDTAGNLYGTTSEGGIGFKYGVVFKLTPNQDGSWTENVLYSFPEYKDGVYPDAGLIFDQAGNLYGSTEYGGTYNYGAVFELTPNLDGSWTESVLDSFSNGNDGGGPNGVIFDHAGNIYGTTAYGGAYGNGVVFKLTSNSDGSWTQSVLHAFNADGELPYGRLIFDTAGNLYGTTFEGGPHGGGSVFELTPNADGTWTESTLYDFRGRAGGRHDGSLPVGVIFDQAGNLYGTTQAGGATNYGVIFKLTPNPDGSWTETLLHHFTGGKDGGSPTGGLMFDLVGNLYGTANVGGNLSYCSGAGCGVVFKLSPNSKGGWSETVLHSFRGEQGAVPGAGLTLDSQGNLYGTTMGTGWQDKSWGSVFEITP